MITHPNQGHPIDPKGGQFPFTQREVARIGTERGAQALASVVTEAYRSWSCGRSSEKLSLLSIDLRDGQFPFTRRRNAMRDTTRISVVTGLCNRSWIGGAVQVGKLSLLSLSIPVTLAVLLEGERCA